MIISKTPFRMSFVGGGTDMETFYKDEMGAVISTTIDKYMYIVANAKFDGRIRINYSRTEEVDCVEDIEHPLVRESLKYVGIERGIDIASLADIPSQGSGLGSSSSYTVGLINLLYAYQGKNITPHALAKAACEIEINRCLEPIGKQDQYAAAYGGLNVIKFLPDNSVEVLPIKCSLEIIKKIESKIVVFYTGRTRSASTVLRNQEQSLKKEEVKVLARRMVKLVFEMKKEIESGNIGAIGEILDENWHLKKCLSDGVSDQEINGWYQCGINAGAKGGKILGAGNGGFLMFYADEHCHKNIENSLSKLKRVRFGFEHIGSQIFHLKDKYE